MTDREDAVEVMANAAWNGSNELKITHNQYDGIAKKMLDALLSSGLAVLMGELEQVGRGMPWGDGSLAIVGEDDEYDDAYTVPLYRIASGESSPNTGPKEQ